MVTGKSLCSEFKMLLKIKFSFVLVVLRINEANKEGLNSMIIFPGNSPLFLNGFHKSKHIYVLWLVFNV